MMRVAVAVVSYFVVVFGVPVPPDPSPLETVQRGDMPEGRSLLEQTLKAQSHRDQLTHLTLQQSQVKLPASTQAQLSSQAQTWSPQFNQHLPVSYQPQSNAGLPLFPAQTQYQPHAYQMPQFFYFPMFGTPISNPTLTYAMPAFYPGTSNTFPTNSGLAGRPAVPTGRPASRVQSQSPTLGNPGERSQQQTPQIVYVVQQPVTPFGGISSEEIQAQRRLGQLGRPQLVPQLGTNVPPGSAGSFVQLSHPANHLLNQGFPAISSATHPVFFPSVPAMPNIPSVQLPNPTVTNVGQPIEETLSTFGALPDVPAAAILPEHTLPSPTSPSLNSIEFGKVPPANPTIAAPTVITENPPEPTASITDIHS